MSRRKLFLRGIACAIFLLAACSVPQQGESSEELSASPKNEEPDEKLLLENEMVKDIGENMDYMDKAKQTYEALLENYYIKEDQLFKENFQSKADDRDFSYLWPFSGVFSAVTALANMTNGEERYSKELKQTLKSLELYFDAAAEPVAYDSYVMKQGGGSKFYDDNQWLGWDFIEASNILDDPQYLVKAKQMFDFSISGWSDALGGGIYWQEDNKTTKNTCSNGPAAVLAMKLFIETGEQEYMDWAIKILDWTKVLWDPTTGVYNDHMRLDQSIDKRTYTYNTATIIHTNALLYKATKDTSYLEEARLLAENSIAHFTSEQVSGNKGFFPQTPWFNAILLKSYIALYEVDPEKDLTYINKIKDNVDHAWEHSRDTKGLFSPDWSGKSDVDAHRKWLLDQAPMVEIYALLSEFK